MLNTVDRPFSSVIRPAINYQGSYLHIAAKAAKFSDEGRLNAYTEGHYQSCLLWPLAKKQTGHFLVQLVFGIGMHSFVGIDWRA